MPIISRIHELHPEITAWRRELHQHPELLFETHRTSAFVAEKLKAFGCDEIKTGLGRTGVVGVIHGRQTTSGRVIGLRADMDALPIVESTDLPYASQNEGLMHACGHDGHTAMLLGAAKYLAETRNFDGTAVVIFQPAEEGGGGGREMCEDGLMTMFGIEKVYGMHNMPDMPIGAFGIRPGPFFASTDQFIIDIEGRGGHAAKPHETVDPTVVASHLTLALQSIVSRGVDPMSPLVVSVTSFHTSGDAFNVIPASVQLKGTVRSMDAESREFARRRLQEIATHTAATFGAVAKVTDIPGYPVMVNDAAETDFAVSVAQTVASAAQVDPAAAAIMGGEDFAYMLEERPGAYILVGNGDSAMLHHPAYDFNDEAIPHGSSYWAQLIETSLPLS
ncbi:M20 aminoacylase family protein [Synoicihabitans lomoniglobus]|uniref:M20 family metallopeptidase n=1 Tax=Synoicihabitans lomoniglobus TaxID=2909285 RepID=A0AAF0CPV2_9BACT|nr:M20 family metallopeptidase [Opitutaceae bacterium LMO-M01]WED65844.1 M20 family metallopeptidase [Opitutaceae bacterium LMO-M01]